MKFYKKFHSLSLSKKQFFNLAIFCVLVFSFFINFSSLASAATGVPKVINFQGRLMDSSGNLLGGPTGTNYCYRFSIYSATTGGTKLWPAGTPSTMTILTREGVFDAPVGDVSAGGDSLTYDFQTSDTTFMNVEVNTTPGTCSGTWESLSPRPQIVSAAYAINSGTVQGLAPTQSASGNQLPQLTSDALVLGGTSAGVKSTSTNALTFNAGASGDVQFFSSANKITSGGALTIAGLMTSAGLTSSAPVNVTSQSATALTVARTGTNYALQVDTNTASSVTGLKVTSAAAGGGLAISVISSGTDENLTIDAKGAGTISIGGNSTGDVLLAGGVGSTGCTITNSTGALSCTAGITATALPWNSITNPTGNQSLSFGTNTSTWTTTNATGNFFGITANSITTGQVINIGHTTSVIANGGSLLKLSSSSVDTSTTTGTLLDLSSTASTAGTLALITNNTASFAGKTLSISSTGITTGRAFDIGMGTTLTTGGAINVSGASYAHGVGQTGSLVNLSFSDASSNSSGTSISNGINIASTVNTNGIGSTTIINAFNVASPTFTACGNAACTWNGLNVSGNTNNTTGLVENAINIAAITGGSATENAINVGSGWDTILKGTTAGTNLIDFTNFKVSSAGVVSALTGLSSSGTINFSGLTASSAVYTDASKNLTTTAPTSGTIGYWSRSGTTLSPATANDIVSISTNSTTASNKTLEALQTGATTGTDYAGYFSNTGAATTNVGLYATASGGTNNYAAIFDGGNVGIGTTTPQAQLEITGNFRLPDQQTNTNASNGIIYKDGTIFIHNFRHPTGGGARPNGSNTFVGLSAGNLTMGSTATAAYEASNNSGFGYQALTSDTTGYYNSAFGLQALTSNTSGYSNSAFGMYALKLNDTGYSNSALGIYALERNTSGYYNAALGYFAGGVIADGSTSNQTSNTSVYLGASTKALADGDTNEIVLGYNTTGFGSNTAAYGNSSITKHIFQTGNVGIGVTNPAVLLDVRTALTNTPVALFYTGGGGPDISIGDSGGSRVVNIGHTGSNLSITGANSGAGGFSIIGASSPVNISSDNASNPITIDAASGAGKFIVQGATGFATTAPDRQVEINSATGNNLRLTYNDSNGSATNYADLLMSSGGDLTITPSGGDTTVTGNLAVSALGGGGTQCVNVNNSGVLGVATCTTSLAWSALTAPTANLSLAHAGYTTDFSFNGVTTANAFSLSSSSLSSGSILNLSSTSTAATSNTQTVLKVATSGANATSTQTTYGGYFTNTHTGTSSTNIAGYFSASGGTNNYAAIFESGEVLIGSTTDLGAYPLQVTGNAYVTSQIDFGSTGTGQGSLYKSGTAAILASTGTLQLSAGSGNRVQILVDNGARRAFYTTDGKFLFGGGSGETYGGIGSDNGTGALVFYYDDSSNSPNEAARFSNAGLFSTVNNTITDTNSLFDLNLTLGNDATADTISALNIDVTSAATGADGDILYGINVANLTSADADVAESAIRVGTGWDNIFTSANASLTQAGALTVTSCTGCGGGVTADSLDFTDFSDTMTLDASTSIAFGASTFGLTFTNNGSGNEIHNLTSTGDFVVQVSGSQAFAVLDNTRVQIGLGSGTATPGLLVLDSKNTTGDPTGTNGGTYYNSNDNEFRCYRNGTWENCGQYQDYTNFSGSYGATSAPSVPSSGELRIFARSIAGRVLPAFIGPSGLDSVLQPLIGRNSVAFFRAYQGATTLTGSGMTVSATGTATAKGSLASTNIYTSTAGVEILVTTAAASAVAGFRIGTAAAGLQYWRGNATGLGGFTTIVRFGAATGTTGITSDRMFVGMSSSTAAPTDVNPSSQTNILGVGYDSTDTNWQIMYNDGSGTATKVDTGIAAPTADRSNLYEIAIFAAPNSSTVSFQFTNLAPGGSTYSTSTTTDIPSTTTFMTLRGYHSVGGTSSVVGFGLTSIYSETDI